MTATFPHLGPLSLVLSQFFLYLNIPFIVPPEHGDAALQTGSGISPEEMCIPFKIMAGNLKSAYAAGADTAIMIATCGPCRLGEYGQLLMEVLKKDGCDFRWALLDSPAEIGMTEFFKRFRILTGDSGAGTQRVVKGVLLSLKLVHEMDSLRRKVSRKAGYLENPREAVKLLQETDAALRRCRTFTDCFSVVKRADKKLNRMRTDRHADPVKLLIVGEIYTSIEPEANRRLEEKLMGLGCSVERHIDLSWWIRYSAGQAIIPQRLKDAWGTKKGIPCNVGGYGRETAAKVLRNRNADGVVKIMPAGCMPEIVAKAFCEDMREKKERRILNLIYDEMTGNAGYDTRLEAFVDMLERRKHVLAGNRHRFHKHRPGFDR